MKRSTKLLLLYVVVLFGLSLVGLMWTKSRVQNEINNMGETIERSFTTDCLNKIVLKGGDFHAFVHMDSSQTSSENELGSTSGKVTLSGPSKIINEFDVDINEGQMHAYSKSLIRHKIRLDVYVCRGKEQPDFRVTNGDVAVHNVSDSLNNQSEPPAPDYLGQR